MSLPNKDHYTPKEIAVYYSISVSQIYELIQEGKIPNVKRIGPSGTYRIPKESLACFDKLCIDWCLS